LIIKGGAAQSVKFWSKHLLNDKTNEKAELREVRGTLSQDLEAVLWEMKDVAGGSRCHRNFLYQAHINPRADEKLTPEQWRHAVDTLERNLGLEGHQRAVIEHVKEGRQHYHIVWNRVDQDTLRVADIGGNYYTMRRTSNQLEQEFGLSRTKPVRDYGDSRPIPLWELNRGRESGIDPKAITAELTQLWHATDSGKAFIAAVEERGYKVAKGDRRDFVILDHAGDAHSLARRLDGVKTAEVRARFAEVDREKLPSVAEARNVQRNLNLGENGIFDRDAAARAWDDRMASAAIDAGKEKDKQRRDERTRQGKEQRLAARDRGHGGMVSEQRAATSRFERNTLAAEAQRQGKPSPVQSRSSRERAEEHAPTAPQAQKAQEHEAKEPRVAEVRQARSGNRTRQPHGAWRERNSGGGWER
jgi:hypothetical protein